MKILDLKVMRGPNIWSNFRQRVIVMRLDLRELEQRPTHRIEGFADRIKALLPSLYTHRCSVGNKGGFFQRVEQGTWMGHVIEHIALELQTLAGTFVGYGRTRSTDRDGVYNVVFAYRVEEAGLYAARAAVRVAECLVAGSPCDVNSEIEELRRLIAAHGQNPVPEALTSEARELEIPFHFAGEGLLILGYGVNQARMRGSVTSATTHLSMELTANRALTMDHLRAARIPVPAGRTLISPQELAQVFKEVPRPFVIKPLTGSHGRKACVTVNDTAQASLQLMTALNAHGKVYAEEFIPGDLYRVLLVGHRIEGAIVQKRSCITGDGKTPLHVLLLNAYPEGSGHPARYGIDDHFIPAKDQQVWFEEKPEEALNTLPEQARSILARTSKQSGLPLCCIDMIVSPGNETETDEVKIIAIESQPDLSVFLQPGRGNPQNVVRPILRLLLAEKNMGRIPLVAVRGNGDSPTITKLLVHFCVFAGKRAGSASREGMTLAGCTISNKDCTGRVNVRGLLFDPSIDTAVIECPTKVILDNGLPFDASDISIITGSAAKKTSRRNEAYESEIKADLTVGRTTPRKGYSILNADNRCDRYEQELYGNIVLYSMDPASASIKRHCGDGGFAAVIENEQIVLLEGQWRTPLVRAGAIHRKDRDFLQAALPATLAAWLLGIQPAVITEAMASFEGENHATANSPEHAAAG